MGLVALAGERKAVNAELVAYALSRAPSLVVDCGNVCDVHRWFAKFPDADYSSVYVYEFELLHKFRDSLRTLQAVASSRGARTIVVTSMGHLFHYQNEAENNELYCHAWEFLRELGRDFDVRVAAESKKMLLWAKRFCVEVVQVGHVVSSQRQNLEQMISEMEGYARSLRPAERAVFTELLRVPLRNVGPVSCANSLHAWSFLLLSIMVEQEKRLLELEHYAGIPHRRVQDEKHHRLVVESRT
jgi:hypothetical protein